MPPRLWTALRLSLIAFVIFPFHAHGESDEWQPMWRVALSPMAIDILINENSKSGLNEKFFRDIVELSFRRNNIRMGDSPYYPTFRVFFRAIKVSREPGGTVFFAYAVDIDVRNWTDVHCFNANYEHCNVVGLFWTHGWIGFGTSNEVRSTVRETLSEIADQFSLDYLRAKEEWTLNMKRRSERDG